MPSHGSRASSRLVAVAFILALFEPVLMFCGTTQDAINQLVSKYKYIEYFVTIGHNNDNGYDPHDQYVSIAGA